jgi:cyclohexanecarboxylate-CoA ligase
VPDAGTSLTAYQLLLWEDWMIDCSDVRRPLGVERFYTSGAWRSQTPLDDLARWARETPDKTAIVTRTADLGQQSQLSFAQLQRMVDLTALGLRNLGVKSGEIVSFQLPNWWQFSALYLACIRIGAVANPILPIMRSREVRYILEEVGSRVLFVAGHYRSFDYVEMARQLCDDVATLDHCVVVGESSDSGFASFERDIIAAAGHDVSTQMSLDAEPARADDVAVVKYTSGTTGQPKGVLHTHNTLYATTRPVPELMGLDGSDRIFMASPLVHMSGFLYGVLMPITWGMTAVYQDVWSGEGMAKAIEDERCTWTMGATPYVIDLLDALNHGEYDISSFRMFACSGAPIPRDLVRRCEPHGFSLLPVWGMTETGAVTFVDRSTPPKLAASTDGHPSPWMEAKVLGDGGVEALPGATGSLRVRGASTFVGYMHRPDLTDAVLDGDGWLNTGDLASIDTDGYVRIEGREKDIIIRGGENVPVVEIEEVLLRHPHVRDVAIIGYPDPRLGERALAVVVPKGESPTLDSLLATLSAAGVAKYYWPERLEILPCLPYTPSGKVRKAILRQQFTERAASSAPEG